MCSHFCVFCLGGISLCCKMNEISTCSLLSPFIFHDFQLFDILWFCVCHLLDFWFSGTFGLQFWSFGAPIWSPWLRFVFFWAPLWSLLVSLGSLLVPFGSLFVPLGFPLVPFGSLAAPCCSLGALSAYLWLLGGSLERKFAVSKSLYTNSIHRPCSWATKTELFSWTQKATRPNWAFKSQLGHTSFMIKKTHIHLCS